MFKNIIAPVQAWLISQGRCVGCGTPLSGSKKKKISTIVSEVACKKCGRVFIFDLQSKRYKRAPINKSS